MPEEPTPQPEPNPTDPPAGADEPQAQNPSEPTPPETPPADAAPSDATGGPVADANEGGADAGETADAGGSLEDEWAAALAEQQGTSDPQAAADAVAQAMAAAQAQAQPASAASPEAGPAGPPAQPFEPPEIQQPATASSAGTLDVLDDVELDLSVELGRTELYIEDVLKLGSGSVIQLDKAAGDPVDIYVNQRLVARGEVLVLNDNFCVRINEIVSPVPEMDDPTQ